MQSKEIEWVVHNLINQQNPSQNLHAYPESVPMVLGLAFTQAPSALKNSESGS